MKPHYRYVECLRGQAIDQRLRDIAFRRQLGGPGESSIFGNVDTGEMTAIERTGACTQRITHAVLRGDPAWALVVEHACAADA